MYFEFVIFAVLVSSSWSSTLTLEVFQHHNRNTNRKKHPETNATTMKVLYHTGESESDLPVCQPNAVCNKVDLYETPWLERQCRCPDDRECPAGMVANDGYTLVDKTRQLKLCEPVKKLPKCRYFRDTTWTLILTSTNTTEQIVHCHCPKNSVAYLVRGQEYHMPDGGINYKYMFSCSPQSRIRCQRKEPCRLFSVRKRKELVDEVNMNSLCQCPHSYRCPRHHADYGVIPGKSYIEGSIRTYSGYCLPSLVNRR